MKKLSLKTQKRIFLAMLLIVVTLLIAITFIHNRNKQQSELIVIKNGEQASNITMATNTPWSKFTQEQKEAKLKTLTPTQYKVTQESATELPFKNAYAENYERGIYVDVVSGEPLFLSSDKFDSGTGWPSFVKPVSADAIALKEDDGLVTARTEVRSKIANSHLGHVFDDGPAERGGLRYCLNSAALRFVPLVDMEKEGYGAYVNMVK
jgi:methionine-R-sulfoxide reductase